MKPYTPYIRKYLKKIKAAGYIIDESGSRFYKDIGCYQILVTDHTVKGFFMAKRLLVWIKNTQTHIIEKEGFFYHEIRPLPLHKIDDFAKSVITDLSDSPKNAELQDHFIVSDLNYDTETQIRKNPI